MSKNETIPTATTSRPQDSGLSTTTGSLLNNRRDLPRCPTASKRRQRANQLSAHLSIKKSGQAFVVQKESGEHIRFATQSNSLDALQPPSFPTARHQSSDRSSNCRHASKKSSKRKGGWRKTTGLTWLDVKEIHEAHHAAAKAGMPLNRFVSIRPPSHITDEALRKNLCYRQVSHLGQKLQRHGAPFVGIRVFEKDVDGMLHVHLLVHVPQHLLKKFDGSGDLIVTDIRPVVPKHIAYITKQRHPLPPDLEKMISHQRRKGEPFKGRRWSLTKDAKAVLAVSTK